MATTTKTLTPTNQQITLPDMTERPNNSVQVDSIGKLADAVNALNSEIEKQLERNGVGTSVTFNCSSDISGRQYVLLLVGNMDIVLVTLHSINYSAVSIKTGNILSCTISGDTITVSGLTRARYYVIEPIIITNSIVFIDN